jgi:predicted RNA-binding Zn ribbon-like protein
MTMPKHPAGIMLISGAREDACLAYANTLSWRGREAPVEALGDFDDLLGWAVETSGLDTATLQALESWAHDHPAPAAGLFSEALALREVIYRVFSALACRDPVPDQDLAALNAALADVPVRDRLARTDAGYAWRIEPARITAPALLAPVVWSAGDLMAGDRLARVRLCADDECLWLFLDESKAGTRRWCNMASCGNRAKARRHYLRTRQA